MQKRALVWESGMEEMPGTALWVAAEQWDKERDWRALPRRSLSKLQDQVLPASAPLCGLGLRNIFTP